MENKNYKEGLKNATDAIIASKARHAMEREESMNPGIDKLKSKLVKKTLAIEKADRIEDLIKNADASNGDISVSIEDDKKRPDLKSIEGEFINHGVMSLHHPKKEGRELICKNREGKHHEIRSRENDDFLKKVLKTKHPEKLYQKKLKLVKKKIGLRESEFTDDVLALYPDLIKKLKIKKKK